MPRNDLMNAMRARMSGPAMRDQSVGESLQTLAQEDPGLWGAIQRTINKRNRTRGTRDTIFDVLADKGRSPVPMMGPHEGYEAAPGESDERFQNPQHYRMRPNDGRPPVAPQRNRSDEQYALSHINEAEDMILGDVPHMMYPGTGSDDRLAMLTPRQEALLRQYGGSGRINPKTGLREYEFGSESDRGYDTSDNGPGASDTGTGNTTTETDPEAAAHGYAPNAEDQSFYAGDPNAAGGGADTTEWSPNDTVPRKSNVWEDLVDTPEDQGGAKTKTGSQADPGASKTMGLGNTVMAGLRKGASRAKDAFDQIAEVVAPKTDEEVMAAVSPLGPFLGGPFFAGVARASEAEKDRIAEENYDRKYDDLTWMERDEIDRQFDSRQAFTGETSGLTGFDESAPRLGGTAPLPAAPTITPSWMNTERPKRFGGDMTESEFNDLDPLQQRTHVASTAMFGPGAVYLQPEWLNHYKRMAYEAAQRNEAPEEIDLMFLRDILGAGSAADAIPRGDVNPLLAALEWRRVLEGRPLSVG